MKNLKVRTKLMLMVLVMVVMFVIVTIITVASMLAQRNTSVSNLEAQVYADYDEEIKGQVDNAISMLDSCYSSYENGECTYDEAFEKGTSILRDLRYGESGYFWADKSDGTNVVLLGNDTEGTNRMATVDANGYAMVKDIIAVGMQDGGGYCDYYFPKEGATESSPKRSYSLYYEPFDIVVGTGNYTDDIAATVAATEVTINNVVKINISFIIGLIVIAIIIILTISIMIAGDISDSVKRFTAFAGKLSEGDFTVRARKKQMERKDEFGELARSMNNVATTFNTVLGSVRNKSDLLGNVVLSVNGNVNDLNDEIENVSATTEELSASMQETAASAEQIQSMVNQIETITEQMTENTQEGTEKAADIHTRAAGAKNDTLQHQTELNQIKGEISQKLTAALENIKVVDQIEVLAQSIISITSQTNLLSLNASIEAARAGEAGKGFAVVANEIRGLADQSKSAVENIQKVTVNVTEAVNELSEYSEKLLGFVSEDVSQSFDDFLNVSDEYNNDAKYIDDMLTNFSAISEELLANVNKIAEAINEVSKASSEGAIGTSDVAERNGVISGKSGNVSEDVKSVENAATQLREQVKMFTINEDEVSE